jgi:hypothetical protein
MICEWVHSTGAILCIGRKTGPSATQSTTNPTWTDLTLIPNLHGARLASNRQAVVSPTCRLKTKRSYTAYRTHSDNTIRAYSNQFSINNVAAPRGDCYESLKMKRCRQNANTSGCSLMSNLWILYTETPSVFLALAKDLHSTIFDISQAKRFTIDTS